MLAWLAALLGAALVVLAVTDMGLAVLHIERESPLSNALSRLVWRGLVRASAPLSERQRGRLLSWGIPLLIGGTVAFWMSLIVLGFGLIFAPAIAQPNLFVVRDRPQSAAFEDALYFSAVSFLTVGYGDLVPTLPLFRFLAVLDGVCGLFTISLSVTYLVAIFPIITRKMVLAAALNQETAGRADGAHFVQRYLAVERPSRLGERLTRLNEELLYLGQAHSHYPLLFYVRPQRVYESFVRVLAVIQGIVAMRYVLDPEVHADVVDDPGVDSLEEGLLYTLHSLEESLHFYVPEHLRRLPDPATARDDFDAMCVTTSEQGLTPVTDRHRQAGLDGYVRFRQATDPYIRTYAASAAYDPVAVWAPYSRARRDAGREPAAARLEGRQPDAGRSKAA